MYDFKSGNIGLDFANTKDWHASQNPVETIKSYADLVSWGEQAGLISKTDANQLIQLAQKSPQQAADDYEFAIQVREAIYRIFSNNYTGKPISEADLSLLNSVACEAMSHLQITQEGRGYHWKLPADHADVILILWNVTRAAVDLLTSDKASRVRECDDDRGCGYLFIDHTRNHSRRWCSMESCGNRAKARRHYSRIQAG
jgi:predicted RNA-binding Zn ribbon-like protein